VHAAVIEKLLLYPQDCILRTKNYSGVAPERSLKISTAILSASRCLSNADISNSIRSIVAINPSSKAGGAIGGSLLG